MKNQAITIPPISKIAATAAFRGAEENSVDTINQPKRAVEKRIVFLEKYFVFPSKIHKTAQNKLKNKKPNILGEEKGRLN